MIYINKITSTHKESPQESRHDWQVSISFRTGQELDNRSLEDAVREAVEGFDESDFDE